MDRSPLALPRRPEPEVPDGRLRVGDAPEEVDLGAVAAHLAHAAHLPAARRHHQVIAVRDAAATPIAAFDARATLAAVAAAASGWKWWVDT